MKTTLKEITSNHNALHAFGGDGSGDQAATLVSDTDGRTYEIEGGWFFFSSNCGSDAISEDGETWRTVS